MAEGFFSKIRTITLGNLHDLLDATINLNSQRVDVHFTHDALRRPRVSFRVVWVEEGFFL